jgi:hypothetical protein
VNLTAAPTNRESLVAGKDPNFGKPKSK